MFWMNWVLNKWSFWTQRENEPMNFIKHKKKYRGSLGVVHLHIMKHQKQIVSLFAVFLKLLMYFINERIKKLIVLPQDKT